MDYDLAMKKEQNTKSDNTAEAQKRNNSFTRLNY